MATEIILAVFTGSALSALITQVGIYIAARKSHKEQTEDKENAEIKALREGLKLLMLDRIRELGQAYIAAGEVDFDDRRILKMMHTAYHDDLKGNGDLDSLMKMVEDLPLKVK